MTVENQTALRRKIGEDWERFMELAPEIGQAYQELPQAVYKNGALDAKTKRLMALSAALVGGCRGCILFQAEHALQLGATVAEILEACGVAISLGGTMAAAQATRVVEYLRERGDIA